MKKRMMAAAMMLGILVSGCGSGRAGSFPSGQSTVYVSKEGGIYTALVEQYDPSDTGYSAGELKAMADLEAAAYNSEYRKAEGQEPVAVTECTVADGTATVVHRYATAEDLCRFTQISQDVSNHPRKFQITTNSVYLTGQDGEGGWTDARKGGGTTLGVVRKKHDLPMIVVTGPVTVQTEGRILYYSGAVTLKDEYTAQVAEGEAYIVFR